MGKIRDLNIENRSREPVFESAEASDIKLTKSNCFKLRVGYFFLMSCIKHQLSGIPKISVLNPKFRLNLYLHGYNLNDYYRKDN